MAAVCPFIDPVIFKVGPFTGTWYGFMYSLGAVIWYLITRSEIQRRNGPIPLAGLPELLFHGLIGGVIGARIGYSLFYSPDPFLERPWETVAFWNGGMSAHGWLAGMSIGGFIFIWKHHVNLRELSDTIYLGLPVGLAFVKMGNFINCEGYGRVTDLPWGVVFSSAGPLPRHPSQLYEALFEGILMFVFLWFMRLKPLKPGDLSCFFLVGYGIMRFIIEFTTQSQPVWHGSLGWLSSGQALSVAVIVIGLIGYAIPRFGWWLPKNR